MEIVNGFRCKDCTDVDYAKRHIDPAHPKDGPYGINAPKRDDVSRPSWDPAVRLDGRAKVAGSEPAASGAGRKAVSGGQLDLSV